MKQNDIALIAVACFISVVLAFLVSRWLFSSPQSREQTAEVVDVITPEFSPPPAQYFNANSVNPTQLIQIGGGGNPNPFNSNPQ